MDEQPVYQADGISAVLPAYNEAGRIGKVLSVLKSVNELASIVVVDDGSTDSTWDEIGQAAGIDPRIQAVRQAKNQGKGQAIFTGWRMLKTPFFVMLDTDLIGLTPQHVRDLYRPVLTGEVDMTLGVFRGGFFATDFAHWATPWLTGQRCLRRDLLAFVDEKSAAGYGLEAALTTASKRFGWKTMRVSLRGISHPISELHRGPVWGLLNRMKMYAQVARALIVSREKN